MMSALIAVTHGGEDVGHDVSPRRIYRQRRRCRLWCGPLTQLQTEEKVKVVMWILDAVTDRGEGVHVGQLQTEEKVNVVMWALGAGRRCRS